MFPIRLLERRYESKVYKTQQMFMWISDSPRLWTIPNEYIVRFEIVVDIANFVHFVKKVDKLYAYLSSSLKTKFEVLILMHLP